LTRAIVEAAFHAADMVVAPPTAEVIDMSARTVPKKYDVADDRSG
jgi:hypothetical protein